MLVAPGFRNLHSPSSKGSFGRAQNFYYWLPLIPGTSPFKSSLSFEYSLAFVVSYRLPPRGSALIFLREGGLLSAKVCGEFFGVQPFRRSHIPLSHSISKNLNQFQLTSNKTNSSPCSGRFPPSGRNFLKFCSSQRVDRLRSTWTSWSLDDQLPAHTKSHLKTQTHTRTMLPWLW